MAYYSFELVERLSYIPLGGNRVSLPRTYANLLVVMLLGGLWHGASLTFVCWGAIHGMGLAIERAIGLNKPARSTALRLAYYLVVQSVVMLAWVFFRSASIQDAFAFVENIGDLKFGTLNRDILLASVFYFLRWQCICRVSWLANRSFNRWAALDRLRWRARCFSPS